MINTKHLLKVVAGWVTIVYVICFGGVALIPGVRSWFMALRPAHEREHG
jgi:hypothetical protein